MQKYFKIFLVTLLMGALTMNASANDGGKDKGKGKGKAKTEQTVKKEVKEKKLINPKYFLWDAGQNKWVEVSPPITGCGGVDDACGLIIEEGGYELVPNSSTVYQPKAEVLADVASIAQANKLAAGNSRITSPSGYVYTVFWFQ